MGIGIIRIGSGPATVTVCRGDNKSFVYFFCRCAYRQPGRRVGFVVRGLFTFGRPGALDLVTLLDPRDLRLGLGDCPLIISRRMWSSHMIGGVGL